MDVVYPLGRGSRWQNNELRYSLRSLKHIDHGKVLIIGSPVSWLRNAEHIGHPDKGAIKTTNALDKIMVACRQDSLSDDFILMNDDFFFLQNQVVENIRMARLSERHSRFIEGHGVNKYVQCMEGAISYLVGMGVTAIHDYELHYPLVINKHKFLEIFEKIDIPVVYRSVYGNLAKVKAKTVTTDYKVYSVSAFRELKEGPFLSTNAFLSGEVKRFLLQTFPDKCEYEG